MRFNAAQLEQYRTQGYVVIPCPFPAELTQTCLDAVARAGIDPEANTTDTKGNHYTLEPQVPDSYWCALDHSLPFLNIELHHEIVELAAQLAGDDDIYFRNGGINELAKDSSFVWHRDSGDDYVEFMHYFSGASPRNGCLRVVPGSHIGSVDALEAEVVKRRRARGQDAPDRSVADVELPGEISLALEPNQLLVRSSRIYHSTWLNQSNAGRLMHHWLFRESSAANHRFHFEEYLTAELIEALTPDQRKVLWLDRDFKIDPKWDGERQREHGRVRWGIY